MQMPADSRSNYLRVTQIAGFARQIIARNADGCKKPESQRKNGNVKKERKNASKRGKMRKNTP